MRKLFKSLILLSAVLSAPALTQTVMDPDNPTCPLEPNWSNFQKMKLTPVDKDGIKVLKAEGVVDRDLPSRLAKVLKDNQDISEIWFRSPGGNARAGNEAGRIIRKDAKGVITRIPRGWSCFSACNFVFMGGQIRMIDKGGHFMVHMFTMTNDRDAIDYSVAMGSDSTVELISDIEQESALLATEDNDFLIRMGVSRKLLTDVMYRQKAVKTDESEDKSTRRCLTIDEAIKYNVANLRG